VPGHLEQVVAFRPAQPQRPGQRREHLLARLRAALLFQPGVVVGRHHGQGGDLFPPQALGPPPHPRGQPDVPGAQRLAAAAQEVGES
jgi:hypothetical protein